MRPRDIRRIFVILTFLGSPLMWLSAAGQTIEIDSAKASASVTEQLLRLEIRRAGLEVRIARADADLAKREVELAKNEYEQKMDQNRRSPNGDLYEFRRSKILWERAVLQSLQANYRVRDTMLRRRQVIVRAQLETGKSLDELMGTERDAADAGKRNVSHAHN